MNSLLRRLPSAILITGFTAGILDITAAVIHFVVKTGKEPIIIFKYIASAVFGSSAFTSPGLLMPPTGVLLHFIVAYLFTIIFFMIRKHFPATGKYPLVTGIIYGIAVWAIMNLIIVPMSNAPMQPLTIASAVPAALILIFCIGIPVSLIANKHYLYKKNKDTYVTSESK